MQTTYRTLAQLTRVRNIVETMCQFRVAGIKCISKTHTCHVLAHIGGLAYHLKLPPGIAPRCENMKDYDWPPCKISHPSDSIDEKPVTVQTTSLLAEIPLQCFVSP